MRKTWWTVALLTLSGALWVVSAESKHEVPDGAADFQGHHYLVMDKVEDVSWTLGKEHCASRGATLAVVTSPEEAAFVAGLSDGRYLFLGASDRDSEGRWAWVDGTPWEFTHWMQGQPNDYSGDEDYLATYDGGEWVDVAHDGRAFWMPTGFLCEWPG